MNDNTPIKPVKGGRYNWKNQPELLVYMGLCEPRMGRWHQFAKVEAPTVVWCEVLDSDLHMLEDTPKAAPQGVASDLMQRALTALESATSFLSKKVRDQNPALIADIRKSLAQTGQAPAVEVAGAPTFFDGYLCRAWGETDLPVAEVVRDLAGVRRFMVREWWGEENPTEYDSDENMGDRIMGEIAERDWRDEGQWSATFEIGGVSVEQVTGALASTATDPAAPACGDTQVNHQHVAVDRGYPWQPMSTCPLNAKVQLLGGGGIAYYGSWNGKDAWPRRWAPLPKLVDGPL